MHMLIRYCSEMPRPESLMQLDLALAEDVCSSHVTVFKKFMAANDLSGQPPEKSPAKGLLISGSGHDYQCLWELQAAFSYLSFDR
jgi:hypothetical protein